LSATETLQMTGFVIGNTWFPTVCWCA